MSFTELEPIYGRKSSVHLVTETTGLVNITPEKVGDKTARKLIKTDAMYDFITRMMAHYLPWDPDFKSQADHLTVLFNLPPDHPFIEVLEYSDLIRREGQIRVNYPRLGLVQASDETLASVLETPYRNRKKDEPREMSQPHKDNFHHDEPAIAVFGSASSADESCGQVGTAVGETGFICIVGGDGKEPGNAMRLISKNAHDAGAYSVGMITTGYLYNAQGASRLSTQTQIYVAETMEERMQRFWERSDMYIGIKGGLGVIMETLYMVKQNILHGEIGKEQKPVYLYNHRGFWDTFIKISEQLELNDDIKVLSTITELKAALATASIHTNSTVIENKSY